jgi:hypothetical protein
MFFKIAEKTCYLGIKRTLFLSDWIVIFDLFNEKGNKEVFTEIKEENGE